MTKIIETERLVMRLWAEDDAKELFEYGKNPNVGPAAGWKPHGSVEESREIIRRIFIPNNAWAIIYKTSNEIVGSIGYEDDTRRHNPYSKELGYSLKEEFWGKGIMTEAAKAVIDYGFKNLGLEIISIMTSPNNLLSQSVIEKCGFTYEGTLRKCYKIYDNSYRDSRIYSLLKEEWVII